MKELIEKLERIKSAPGTTGAEKRFIEYFIEGISNLEEIDEALYGAIDYAVTYYKDAWQIVDKYSPNLNRIPDMVASWGVTDNFTVSTFAAYLLNEEYGWVLNYMQ